MAFKEGTVSCGVSEVDKWELSDIARSWAQACCTSCQSKPKDDKAKKVATAKSIKRSKSSFDMFLTLVCDIIADR